MRETQSLIPEHEEKTSDDPDRYNVHIYDGNGGPIAGVNATAFVEEGNEIVEAVREAVEPEGDDD